MSPTPLLDRIAARKGKRIGPVAPVPILERVSPFTRRLIERRLPVKWLADGCGPDGRAA